MNNQHLSPWTGSDNHHLAQAYCELFFWQTEESIALLSFLGLYTASFSMKIHVSGIFQNTKLNNQRKRTNSTTHNNKISLQKVREIELFLLKDMNNWQ